MRESELISCKKVEVWECFLEEAGVELDSMTLRMVICKASAGAWPLGKVPFVLDPHEFP